MNFAIRLQPAPSLPLVIPEVLADVLVRIAGFGHEFIRKGLRA